MLSLYGLIKFLYRKQNLWTLGYFVFQALRNGEKPDGVIGAAKRIRCWPKNWRDCVVYARLQFEKYYNHKVL